MHHIVKAACVIVPYNPRINADKYNYEEHKYYSKH